MENDFILAGMKALANFTYNVTMRFLNCVEVENQDTLVNILPKLFTDLQTKSLNTLAKWSVKWTHVNISKMVPETDLDHLIIGEMCLQAAKGIELQCKREYWGDDTVRRATELHKLTPEERKNLPTNNINAERYLAKFGYLASKSAQHSNRFFKAKRIRDDLILLDTQ